MEGVKFIERDHLEGSDKVAHDCISEKSEVIVAMLFDKVREACKELQPTDNIAAFGIHINLLLCVTTQALNTISNQPFFPGGFREALVCMANMLVAYSKSVEQDFKNSLN